MIYRLLFRALFERLDPETAHGLALRALRTITALPVARRLIAFALSPRDEALRVSALGLDFPTPLGLAAGFDKDATSFDGLAALGFGSIEVGTVTALAQPGRPRPRIARVPESRALVNRMGFPNSGCDAVAKRLQRSRPSVVVGVNVGKSAVVPAELDRIVDDYVASIRACAPSAGYVVLNVSSPNTEGLRDLQAPQLLRALIRAARDELHALGADIPLLVKVSPDLADDEIDAIANLALETRLDGIIAVNTTIGRAFPDGTEIDEQLLPGGGVSGAPLEPRSLEVLRRLRTRVGSSVLLVSVGGVASAEDVFERLRSGATLVQAYTGFVYGGPLWPRRLNRGLARLVRDSGASSVSDLIGSAVTAEPSTAGSQSDLPQVAPLQAARWAIRA